MTIYDNQIDSLWADMNAFVGSSLLCRTSKLSLARRIDSYFIDDKIFERLLAIIGSVEFQEFSYGLDLEPSQQAVLATCI